MAEKKQEAMEQSSVSGGKNEMPEGKAAAEYNPFAWAEGRDESDSERQSSRVTVHRTSMEVFRRPRMYEGQEYNDFAIGLLIPINGTEVEHTVSLTPYPNHGGTHALLKAIYGERRTHPLSVIRTEQYNRRTGTNDVSYTACVVGSSESGIELSVELRANSRNSGGQMWNNICNVLKFRGELE